MPATTHAQSTKRIVFTSGLDPASAHVVIAGALGLFEKHGLNVTVKKFPSALAGVRTVFAGENDAAQVGDMPVVSPLAQGAKIKIIAGTRKKLKRYGAAIAADFIKKPSDLNGRRVGMLRGSPVSHVFFEFSSVRHV